MTECTRCGTSLPQEGATSIQPMVCPSCGYRTQGARAADTGLGLIQDYFRDTWRIMAHPVLFFRYMPIQGGWRKPLAFALVTHWLSAAFAFLWSHTLGGFTSQVLQNLFIQVGADQAEWVEVRKRIAEWFFGAGAVLLDPFLTLFSVMTTALLVFIGARILIAPGKSGHREEITYESALRIICFGMAPSLFTAVPFLGGFIASLWVMIVTIIGVREVYRVETPRAMIVALFPKFLFLGIIGLGFILFFFTLFRLFAF